MEYSAAMFNHTWRVASSNAQNNEHATHKTPIDCCLLFLPFPFHFCKQCSRSSLPSHQLSAHLRPIMLSEPAIVLLQLQYTIVSSPPYVISELYGVSQRKIGLLSNLHSTKSLSASYFSQCSKSYQYLYGLVDENTPCRTAKIFFPSEFRGSWHTTMRNTVSADDLCLSCVSDAITFYF